jgi:ligand-binding sensor domain-containing protein
MKKTFARGLAVLALTICFVGKATAIGAFKTFDNSRGLPDNSVNCMRQDSHGYVWMGTWNGLCRFDGTTYDTFRREPGNDASLSNNMVRDVMPADRGVWVATDGGLDFFSFGNGIFHHCAIADSRGRMHRFTTKMKQLLVSGGRVLAVDGRGYTYNVNEDATLTPIK